MASDRRLVQSFSENWKRVYDMTSKLLEHDLSPQKLVYTIPGSRSHLLWLTGHLSVPIEFLLLRTLTGEKTLPDDYRTRFGFGSDPIPDVDVYPSHGELRDFYRKLSGRALTLLDTMDDDDMEKPVELADERMRTMFPTAGRIFQFLPIHESYHSGQMKLLLLAQGVK